MIDRKFPGLCDGLNGFSNFYGKIGKCNPDPDHIIAPVAPFQMTSSLA